MSRETVRMVREGRRPPVVVGTEPDRDELLARIAMLELDLMIANKALGRLLMPVVWVYPGEEAHYFQPDGNPRVVNCRCHDELREDGDGDYE